LHFEITIILMRFKSFLDRLVEIEDVFLSGAEESVDVGLLPGVLGLRRQLSILLKFFTFVRSWS
jgi:hypothetical protein